LGRLLRSLVQRSLCTGREVQLGSDAEAR
jgi:hypothetical protein